MKTNVKSLQIGWAEADLTPEKPVIIAGQFYARLPEAPPESLTATVLTLDNGDEHAVFVSCDLNSISDELGEAIRSRIQTDEAEPDVKIVIINATHTHTGPENRSAEAVRRDGRGVDLDALGIELPCMPVEEFVGLAADRIVTAVLASWSNRRPGKVAWGLDFAVLGRNRRWVDHNG